MKKKMLWIFLLCALFFSCDHIDQLNLDQLNGENENGGGNGDGDGNGNGDNGFINYNWPSPPDLGTPRALQIPPLIDSRTEGGTVTMTMRQGSVEFFTGSVSRTFGFNGDFLGPTVRLYRGDTVNMRITNNIGEVTTVHGHGLHVPGSIDGGPQLKIDPGTTWDFQLPVAQEASTSWYHPHLMGKTAEHVFKGLAGLYLIEDSNSQSMSLPEDYGVDDIPLVIQDRLFRNSVMEYTIPDMDEGYLGNVVLVNGTVNPYMDVPRGMIRLRLLNGSNARFYRFSFSDSRSFQKIATDGGFLDSPVTMSSLVMAPGERNEIVVDFTNGQNVNLVTSPTYNTRTNDPLFNGQGGQVKVLELRPDSRTASGSVPSALNNISYYNRSSAVKTRSFVLNMNDGGDFGYERHAGSSHSMMMGINGRPMDMNYINERVNLGELELWTIRTDQMTHPFHLHGTSFQVLTINGMAVSAEDRGWKDTVIVHDDQVTEILVKFGFGATDTYPYMYHCHILEHEDMGMMGQFTVK